MPQLQPMPARIGPYEIPPYDFAQRFHERGAVDSDDGAEQIGGGVVTEQGDGFDEVTLKGGETRELIEQESLSDTGARLSRKQPQEVEGVTATEVMKFPDLLKRQLRGQPVGTLAHPQRPELDPDHATGVGAAGEGGGEGGRGLPAAARDDEEKRGGHRVPYEVVEQFE